MKLIQELLQILETKGFGIDDIAIGGTVIYKTLHGKSYKMSKAKRTERMNVYLANGDITHVGSVVSTDASEWKKYEGKSSA